MSRNIWITLVVAIVFAGGGFWAGISYAQSKSPARGQFAGGAAAFAGRVGGGGTGGRSFGGATMGTIISSGNGSFTIELPNATTTGATTGTKIVLFDSSTQIQEMQNVSSSNLTEGKNVLITGTQNSDGSITATNIQIRPEGGARGGTANQTQ